MKNNYKITLLLLVTLSVNFGCEDILEENAKETLTPDQFYQNEDEALLALNGLQATLQNRNVSGSEMVYYQMLGTDEAVVARPLFGGVSFSIYIANTSDGAIAGIWRNLYSGIRDANLLLSRVGSSTTLSDEEKSNVIGQALFYRSYFYYRLTTMFGDVPYWRDEIDINAVSLLGKTSAETIQTEMIADLQEAISSGGLSTERWNQNGGRVTLWAVKMMKAHYHMWLGQYAEARTELIDITANSGHDSALAPYADKYREGNDLDNEIIFGVENLIGFTRNDIHNQAHPNAGSEGGGSSPAVMAFEELDIFTRVGALTLNRSTADAFQEGDIRRIYNVFDRHTLQDGTEALFKFVYIPKFLRAKVPVEDPLFVNPDPNGQSGATTRLMMMSDAYLMLSEAEFMLGGSNAAALAAINIVRERANLDALTSMDLADIQLERKLELLGEGFGRKTDLIRWGILEETVAELPALEIAAGADQQSIDRVQNMADIFAAGPEGKYRVLPIPFDDITKSQDLGGALTQNPLWE